MHFVAFSDQRVLQFPWQVFIEEDFHVATASFSYASSRKAPCTDSSARVGYSSTISATLIPLARHSSRNATEMRVPRTRGLPPRCSLSETIQFWSFMALCLRALRD